MTAPIAWVSEVLPAPDAADIAWATQWTVRKTIGPIWYSIELFPGSIQRAFFRNRKVAKQFHPKRHTRMAGK